MADLIKYINDIPLCDIDARSSIENIKNNYATKTELNTKANASAIPTKTSALTNDSGFITSLAGYATESFVTHKIAEAQLNGGGSSVDLSNYATKAELSNYADKNHVHSNYLTAIPSEYITETELNNFNYNKTTIDQKVNLSNYYTKQEVESKILEFMGGKKLVYKTQAQYNALSDTEKNREDIVYNIIDMPDQLVFNANGDLVVTINGVSKTFAPKA